MACAPEETVPVKKTELEVERDSLVAELHDENLEISQLLQTINDLNEHISCQESELERVQSNYELLLLTKQMEEEKQDGARLSEDLQLIPDDKLLNTIKTDLLEIKRCLSGYLLELKRIGDVLSHQKQVIDRLSTAVEVLGKKIIASRNTQAA